MGYRVGDGVSWPGGVLGYREGAGHWGVGGIGGYRRYSELQKSFHNDQSNYCVCLLSHPHELTCMGRGEGTLADDTNGYRTSFLLSAEDHSSTSACLQVPRPAQLTRVRSRYMYYMYNVLLLMRMASAPASEMQDPQA
jgi:hypothetical protein